MEPQVFGDLLGGDVRFGLEQGRDLTLSGIQFAQWCFLVSALCSRRLHRAGARTGEGIGHTEINILDIAGIIFFND